MDAEARNKVTNKLNALFGPINDDTSDMGHSMSKAKIADESRSKPKSRPPPKAKQPNLQVNNVDGSEK